MCSIPSMWFTEDHMSDGRQAQQNNGGSRRWSRHPPMCITLHLYCTRGWTRLPSPCTRTELCEAVDHSIWLDLRMVACCIWHWLAYPSSHTLVDIQNTCRTLSWSEWHCFPHCRWVPTSTLSQLVQGSMTMGEGSIGLHWPPRVVFRTI